MKIKVITTKRMLKTDGASKDDNYDYLKVGGIVETTKGNEFCEINLYDFTGALELDRMYTLQAEVYVNAKKKLAMAVRGLVPFVAEATKRAA